MLRRATRSTAVLTAVVLLGGLAVTAGAGAALRAAERDTADQIMDRRTALAQAAIAAEARRYVDTAQSVAASVGAQQNLTAAEFDAITAPLEALDLPGANGIALVVPAAHAQVADVQRQWHRRGAAGLVLKPGGGPGGDHAFVVLRRGLDGRAASAAGLDLTREPAPAAALAEARRTGQVSLSSTYRLLRDGDLPAEQRPLSFLLAAPVYALPAAGAATGPSDGEQDPPARGAFRGWVTMALGGQAFAGAALEQVAQGHLAVSLLAVAADGRRVEVAALDTAPGDGAALARDASVQVAQQHWIVRARALPGLVPAASRYLDELGMAALTGLSVLLAALVFALGSSRNRAEAKVAAATAALRAKQEYVGALVDTMDVILVAADDDGRFTLVNRQAYELHGLAEDADHCAWQTTALTHFYETDGVTRMPPECLPVQRTLTEGEVHDLEFIVARPGEPRRWLSAHGRRLYAADGTSLGVVTAAHDITRLRESECALRQAHTDLAAVNADLERSNEELSAFAGLVSHDLKSPLAGVAGYVELLRGLYEDGTMPAEARPFLDRISSGVQRMRSLIEDLLTYATARNSQPDVAAVDLQTLVEDVVAVHTDRLRLRGGPDQLFPDVYVAPLPAVQGDPMMVRQLMDNLIGNALKYVQPGRAARVDVTAGPADDAGWVRVVVADRGIGIPDGQHELVFNSFHRAHRRSPYPGTGLGLAICHQIVARHGGAIGAADNPGGGAQFWFTLPAATRGTAVEPADAARATGRQPAGTAAGNRP